MTMCDSASSFVSRGAPNTEYELVSGDDLAAADRRRMAHYAAFSAVYARPGSRRRRLCWLRISRMRNWCGRRIRRPVGACVNGAGMGDLASIAVMVPEDSGVEQTAVAAAGHDSDSAEWLRVLAGVGPQREAALARLHAMLVRIARGEVRRRGPRLQLTGPELDDLAYQAAADALIAITGKLGQFRGDSRFTTWAYKFVIFEVSAKIGRHFWRHPSVPFDTEDWDRLPGRLGFDPAQEAEWRDLLAALHRAVDEELTARQRRVFVAIVLNNVPLDTLVIEMASNRNAIYKTLFDARRKLRAALVANGYLPDDRSSRS